MVGEFSQEFVGHDATFVVREAVLLVLVVHGVDRVSRDGTDGFG
jgi:hypothetical protein